MTNKPNHKQIRQACIDFIILVKAGAKHVNAMQCSIDYNTRYGVSIDWHEFSDILDELARREEIARNGISRYGLHQYDILAADN